MIYWLAPLGCILIADSLLRFMLLCLRGIVPFRESQTAIPSRFLILIPARNEEKTITGTIEKCLQALAQVPGGELWIIADRCTDQTASLALSSGARVSVRARGRNGKGAALGWWFEHYRDQWKRCESVIVLDADSRIDSSSLSILAGSITAGAYAAQAMVIPASRTICGRLAGYSELLRQRIEDEARRRWDWPVPLMGTGMAFRSGLLAELAPRLHTQVEDLELNILLCTLEHRVVLVPEARVLDSKPAREKEAARQRARWLRGQIQVIVAYRREVARILFRGRSGHRLLLATLILRPKVLFSCLRIVALASPLWPFAAAGLLLDGLYAWAGARVVDRPRRYWIDLLAVFRYVWIWMSSINLSRMRRGWLRSDR